MQLIQYCHVSSFSTVITNDFIGEDFHLSQHSFDGYEALGFDVRYGASQRGAKTL
jgi:hypothetical protein